MTFQATPHMRMFARTIPNIATLTPEQRTNVASVLGIRQGDLEAAHAYSKTIAPPASPAPGPGISGQPATPQQAHEAERQRHAAHMREMLEADRAVRRAHANHARADLPERPSHEKGWR